jgi:hypothetical protein
MRNSAGYLDSFWRRGEYEREILEEISEELSISSRRQHSWSLALLRRGVAIR